MALTTRHIELGKLTMGGAVTQHGAIKASFHREKVAVSTTNAWALSRAVLREDATSLKVFLAAHLDFAIFQVTVLALHYVFF